MRFYAYRRFSTDGVLVQEHGLVVDSPTWFAARAFALRELGEGTRMKDGETSIAASVELRWSGSDAGRTPDLHLQARRRDRRGRWRPWSRA